MEVSGILAFHEDLLLRYNEDFAHWARVLMRDEYKYLTSDDAVKEAIEANEYEFTEAGKLV